MDQTNSLEVISKGALIIIIGLFISKLLTYIYRLIIARFLGPESYGLISLGFSVVGIFALVAALGIPNGILRYVSYYKGKKDLTKINETVSFGFKLTFCLSLVAGVLLFFLSDLISINVFHNTELIWILKLFSITVPVLVLAYSTEMLIQAFQAVKYLVYTRYIGENIIKVGLTVILFLVGLKLLGAVIAYMIAITISLILMIYFIHKKIYHLPNIFKNYAPIKKEILFFSIPLLLSNLFIYTFLWVDTIILGYFTKADVVGIYNAAVPSAKLIYFVPVAILTLYTPVLIENYAKLKRISGSLYKTINKWIFLINLPIMLLLISFSKPFLKIFFGEVYAVGYSVLNVLVIGHFVYCFSTLAEKNLIAIKKTKTIMVNKMISGSLNVVLNIILISKYGMIGAAYATTVALFVESIIVWGQSFYYTKIIPFKWNYVKAIVCALISLIVIKKLLSYVFNFYNFWMLLISVSLICLIYLGLLILIKFFDKEDLQIVHLVQRKIGLKLNFIRKIIR